MLFHTTPQIFLDITHTFTHVSQWCQLNKLELNIEKTKLMTIKKQPVKYEIVHSLQQVDELKLLGVTISNDLKWNKHVILTIKSASPSLYLIRKCRAIFSKQQLILLYNSYILSKMCYAAPLFICLPQSLQYHYIRLFKRAHHAICGQQCNNSCLIDPSQQKEKIAYNLFTDALRNTQHPLSQIMPTTLKYTGKLMMPICRTERYRKSFIPTMTTFHNAFI